MNHKNLSVVILAAGDGTRMKSNTPKPLQKFTNATIIEHILSAVSELQPKQIVVVYSGDLAIFKSYTKNYNITWVEQKKKLGTANAVLAAIPAISGTQTLILCGDTPLITSNTLNNLVDNTYNKLGLITTILEKPYGFGRILRDNNGNLIKIAEEKDASVSEKNIKEISSGIFSSPTKFLVDALPKIGNNNSQNEYYLPDIIPIWLEDNSSITTVIAEDEMTVRGINNFSELAELESYYNYMVAKKLMLGGVKITQPNTLICNGNMNIDPGVIIENNVTLKGNITLKSGCHIEANCILENVIIDQDTKVRSNSIITESTIGKNATIGPFAYIRPKCNIANSAKIGAFVEVKNTNIGENSKASHLTYLGDSNIGNNVNIGAGTITCNYDGINKFTTTIEDNAFIGSGSQLIAPVKISNNSYIAAGSCITDDTESGKLTIARARQQTVNSWVNKSKNSN
jgi:bifunctional UDP-N-acetylglucosamine pyrophosphorylase/glucosamine-1-phosphate N-acetyltransferase